MEFVKRQDIQEWAEDCKRIGIVTRRFGYANTQLPEDEVRTAGIE